MNADERDELARLLPLPEERDLPAARRLHLKEFVMTEIHHDVKPKRRLLRPAVLAPALAAAAALAVAVPAVLGGGSPAYAVTDNPDGTITIEINEFKDAKALAGSLRERGVDIVVDYIPRGKKCSPQPRSQDWGPDVEFLLGPSDHEYGKPVFRVDPSVIEEGQTGVLEVSISELDGGGTVVGSWSRVSNGPVAPCELVDSTEAPLGPPRNGD
ncbi:hypothetical protein [Nonomuraea africana]|uniref:DUF4232 domain-containing protein n=1 Tax=Nonomuraea africana TaxID=46171 RepID=A0ABR9KJG7_9ACTN|nr:hypothetical protein [Nonomuraea africana]MBE1562154.1 hypothetical protein [Nonomuraea africana]